MEAIAAAVPGRISAIREVWSSPLYRGATVAMFLSGLGTSAAAPQIVLYLVKELGASLPVAGLYYLTSLAGPVAGYIVGSYSDRTGIRLNLFRLCALAGFVGWVAVALSTALWIPFVISVIVLAFSGAAVSQIWSLWSLKLEGNPGAFETFPNTI
jgi:MFS transporter, SET family, sugar efflux transporter